MDKEARKYKKALVQLTETVCQFLTRLDAEMLKPSTPERGEIVADLSNRLELANDAAMHFGLDESFQTIHNRKAKMQRKVKNIA